MQKLNNQNGFAAFEIVVIVTALLFVGGAGYYAYRVHVTHTAQSGTIDVRELGIKLTISDINGWNYTVDPGTNNSTVDLEYQGYASGRLTRYNAPPSDPNILDQKQLGSYYFGLTRQPCPCDPIGEQAFNKLTSALNSAVAD